MTVHFPTFSVLTVSSLAMFAFAGLAAVRPDFSGSWKLDPSRSQDAHGAVISLTIKSADGKLDYRRTMRERDGKEAVSSFTCAPGSTGCNFDEDGHKAKVSLWYNGPALVILKTEGPKDNATTERKLELSPDGTTLTVEFSNFAGNEKPQKLVFVKQQ